MAASRKTDLLAILLIILSTITYTSAFIEGLYCGRENCYDVLGVNRDSSKQDIAKSYRRLAKKYHPDMHRKQEDKKKYELKFQSVATAYETLRDEETRKEYDYMLDNPDEVYRHYYYYYRRRVAPKVDPKIVIAVTITVISVVQYYSAWSNYKEAIKYLATVPKYRMRAIDIAKSDGLFDKSKKKDRRRPKEEVKEEEEATIRQVIENKMDIRGGYSKPSIYNILWLQILLSPYYLGLYLIWYVRWIWKFTINKEEYGEEEKLYLIRKYMSVGGTQWEAIDDAEKEKYLNKELWKKENFKVWKAEQEEEMKRKLAEDPQYKRYRRWMRNKGPGQITFADD